MPGCSPRIVSGDQIRAVSEKFRDVESFFDVRDDLLRRFLAGLQKVISRSDSRGTGQSARSICSCLKSKFLRGVRIQQIRLKHAVFNDDRASCRNALSIKRASAEAAGNGAIINDGDLIACDLLPNLPARNDAPR